MGTAAVFPSCCSRGVFLNMGVGGLLERGHPLPSARAGAPCPWRGVDAQTYLSPVGCRGGRVSRHGPCRGGMGWSQLCARTLSQSESGRLSAPLACGILGRDVPWVEDGGVSALFRVERGAGATLPYLEGAGIPGAARQLLQVGLVQLLQRPRHRQPVVCQREGRVEGINQPTHHAMPGSGGSVATMSRHWGRLHCGRSHCNNPVTLRDPQRDDTRETPPLATAEVTGGTHRR